MVFRPPAKEQINVPIDIAYENKHSNHCRKKIDHLFLLGSSQLVSIKIDKKAEEQSERTHHGKGKIIVKADEQTPGTN